MNVENCEDDSWLTVGEASAGEDAATQEEGQGHQPNFFTKLSMNGLTQELASALTSTDSAKDCTTEDDDGQLDLTGWFSTYLH